MNQQKNTVGLQVALGILGFLAAFLLSLGGGNTVITSLIRGFVGLLLLFLLGYVLKFALRVFVGPVEQPEEEFRGRHLDLLLPTEDKEQKQAQRAADDDADFVPLFEALQKQDPAHDHKKKQDVYQDMDPQKLAEAMRHLDE